jgi:ATP-dependent RNA helicase DeaD
MPTTFADLPLGPGAAGALEQLGWAADEPEVRDVVPVLARGHNLVATLPPAPAFAAPALAGVLSTEAARSGLTFVLAPEPSLGEWCHVLGVLSRGAPHLEHAGASTLRDDQGVDALIVRHPKHAAVRLRSEAAGGKVVVSTPQRCAALFQASAVPANRVSGIVLAWPELWDDADEAVTAIFQEVPKASQRVVLTSDPDATADLVERHAWRAATVGVRPGTPLVPTAHTVAVAWSRRVAVLPELVAALEAEAAWIWTADTTQHDAIRRALAGSGIPTHVGRTDPSAVTHVVAFDPPPVAELANLAAAGTLTLLMPPGTERWVMATVRNRQPLLLPSDPMAGGTETARRRQAVVTVLEEGDLDEGLLALGPLFERYEPTLVAAAVYRAWRTAGPEPLVALPVPAAVERIWINAGRKDHVGPNDLVGLLVNELDVRREHIGRIELRDTFSLVEVPAGDAERIAGSLTGRTLRRRRLVARVDRPKRQRATQRGGPY